LVIAIPTNIIDGESEEIIEDEKKYYKNIIFLATAIVLIAFQKCYAN
jgi:flavorubredoxin